MSIDVQRVSDDSEDWHLIWSGPFLIIVSAALLWQELGEVMNFIIKLSQFSSIFNRPNKRI